MNQKLLTLGREEGVLGLGAVVSLALLFFRHDVEAGTTSTFRLALCALGLFAVVLACCYAVIRHAEHLAKRLGEPYGTLILTLAVTAIEAMSISAISINGDHSPVLVRDTLFAVVMILLNGMVGVSLLLGGWRHREQQYNLQGANTYLGVIIPLTVLSLILPNFTQATAGATLSLAQGVFVALASVGLYAAFLAVQTSRHRAYFTLGAPEEAVGHDAAHGTARPPLVHAALLFAYMAPLVFLAEALAKPTDTLLKTLDAPHMLSGVVIAVLVATPEAIGAVRAAMANRLQRSMNIFLGSVLSTIGLTIPAMIALSYFRGEQMILGLDDANAVLLVLTLGVSVVTFSSRRTNALQGAVHLVLFGAYLLLIFEG